MRIFNFFFFFFVNRIIKKTLARSIGLKKRNKNKNKSENEHLKKKNDENENSEGDTIIVDKKEGGLGPLFGRGVFHIFFQEKVKQKSSPFNTPSPPLKKLPQKKKIFATKFFAVPSFFFSPLSKRQKSLCSKRCHNATVPFPPSPISNSRTLHSILVLLHFD